MMAILSLEMASFLGRGGRNLEFAVIIESVEQINLSLHFIFGFSFLWKWYPLQFLGRGGSDLESAGILESVLILNCPGKGWNQKYL